MASFALNLLGPPAFMLPHGQPARRFGAAKGLALLTYLALEPGPHTREELAALLWGDSPESAARASLRQALKRLRAAVGDALQVDRATVQLGGGIECDVHAFLAAAKRRLREAADFDVPRFLAGFSLRHSPVFDEWVAMQRRRLLQRYADVLQHLGRGAIAQSRWLDAVGWADRWLACEPLSDEAARLAIEALYLSGDRGAALARFAEHRDRLARDVGTKPGAALLELAQRIGSDSGPPRRAAAEGATGPSFEASLVGRELPWGRLTEAWKAVADGAGRVVLMEGEAGVGKTRLAEEFLRWARLAGATVLRGRGYDSHSGIPYGPVVEALRGVLEAPGLAGTAPEWLTEVTRLVPELRRRFPTLPEPRPPVDAGERWRLYEGIAQLVLAVAAERPTAIFVDDLQWCDGETCAVLHFLSRRFERSPVALLATVTLGELERDAAAARLSRALRTQGQAVVISLAPLGEEAVWLMIQEMARVLTPTGGRRLAHRVHQVTDGNPFYVIELLKTLFAQGLLVVDPATGRWRAPPSATDGGYTGIDMPRSVRDAIGERVQRLPYEQRDLLATMAVAGRGARTDLLSHVHGMSRLRAAALADALVDRRLVVEESGVYRCAHPVIAEVVRESLTPARRRELHRAIALSLVTIASPAEMGELAGEIARHADKSGERGVAYRYALVASDAAAGRYAFDEALSWLDLAAAAAADATETDAVNRLTAQVLKLAGWSEPPRAAAPRSSAGRGIERRDLDVGAAADRS